MKIVQEYTSKITQQDEKSKKKIDNYAAHRCPMRQSNGTKLREKNIVLLDM